MSGRTWISGTVLAVSLSVMIYVLVTPEKQLPTNMANGSYASSCCGTMILHDGQMHIGKATVPYKIEADKVGPYILPRSFVGEGLDTFRLDEGSAPLKLRLNSVERPTQITLDRGDVATAVEM